jgi:hypothetical protein
MSQTPPQAETVEQARIKLDDAVARMVREPGHIGDYAVARDFLITAVQADCGNKSLAQGERLIEWMHRAEVAEAELAKLKAERTPESEQVDEGSGDVDSSPRPRPSRPQGSPDASLLTRYRARHDDDCPVLAYERAEKEGRTTVAMWPVCKCGLDAALSAAPQGSGQATGWQPIETAKKENGVEILAAWNYAEGASGQHAQCIRRVVWWSACDACWWSPAGAMPSEPTHWMPLSAPAPQEQP